MAAHAAEVLEDSFERQDLAGPLAGSRCPAIAWQAKGTWQIENGQLVNRSKSREKWPNEALIFCAPKPMPVGGVVRVDALHDALHRTPGYLSLLARDRETKAYVEWVSNRHSTAAEHRTSETDPEFKPLPNPCRWTGRQFATYGVRWKGVDEKTGKGAVDLLFAPKAGPDAELAVAASLEVANLRKLDQFELVLNADDPRAAAATAAFDNFHIELSEGPGAPLGFAAKPTPEGRIRVTWQDTPNEAAYLLQRAVGGPPRAGERSGEWQELARPAANAAAHDDAQVRPSVLYRYRLRAESPKGESSWTPPAAAFLPGPPLAPSGLKSSVQPSGLVAIEWQDNAVNEGQFIVERQQGADGAWQTFKAAAANLTSVEDWMPDPSPAPGARGAVRYRVRAVNEQGASAWSEAAEAARPKPPPALIAPADLILHSQQADMPVTSVDLVFDQPVRSSGANAAADFAITAHKHPWHAIELPKPEIASVTFDPEGRKARVVFSPAIPDLVEYRIAVRPGLTGVDGAPAAAPPVRVAVLLGDDVGRPPSARDGFVAPAAGQRLGKRLAMPPLPIGIMAEDIEWNTENGAHNVEHIIELMDAYKGIDFFRINLWWGALEPVQGQFDEKYVGFLRRLLAAAEQRQLPLEIGIRQVEWPLWACNHKGFHNALYEPRVAAKFADTWRRLAAICHECPAVFAYWPISEEYPAGNDLRNYLNYVSLIAQALRSVHPGCVVKVRPAAAPFQGGNEVTPTVSQQGAQDLCMAAGVYPTGWQWDIPNPTPLSTASFNNMEAFRYYAPEVQGGPNAIGEIGFRATAASGFGDAERLVAFERCLTLAHDLGMLEFVIWGEAWTFSDPATWFPRLRAFRDVAIRRPRNPGFDLRLVNDAKASFAHPPHVKQTELDLSGVFRWLEERGYRFCLTTPAAMALQKGEFKATVKLSDLADLSDAERVARLRKALEGLAPSGVVLPWLQRTSYRQSLTGLPCGVEIEFPGARGICDAVSLSPTRLQVYAPPGTLVRWRRPAAGGDWNDFVTPSDSRVAIIDLPAQ